ncbi:MAG TPA: 3-phosphoserine/phosphohydroxythreonine transaminase [Abditibacteriaceae bacterium]|jgi:phosphoserine aminotransferase
MRNYNFSAGPAALPVPVLEQVAREMLELPGAGASIMEISHRSKKFEEVIAHAENGIRSLLGLPEEFHVLFLQGGASLQFAMAPMNMLAGSKKADYIITGAWGQKAIKDAQKYGAARVAATTKESNFSRLPESLDLDSGAEFVHFTSNETIQGVQWPQEPQTNGVPLICDASSDILSRPIDVAKYGLIYAGAQKNIGPSGVTVVILRDDLLQKCASDLPPMLDYRVQVDNKSLYNTPNTFGVYVIGLVCDYLQSQGGLAGMQARNEEKARLLYDAIDSTDFYTGHAASNCRSRMNVTWRLPSEELEKRFIEEAKAQGMVELKGHRSVGGLRASIYNAFPREGVVALVEFMKEFERKTG